MNCMKCGRETTDERIFCNLCLEEMEKYPVRPGTVILLPRRREDPLVRKSHPRKKSPPPPEEQVKVLRKAVRRLLAVILLLLLLLGATGYFTVTHFLETDTVFLPGQNYSSVTDILKPSGN